MEILVTMLAPSLVVFPLGFIAVIKSSANNVKDNIFNVGVVSRALIEVFLFL